MTPRVGFVGLGRMGLPMARRLVAAGLDPLVHDVAPEARAAIARAGARVAASPGAVGAACDVVGVCVPADRHVRAVCAGDDGLFAAARPGTVVAVHSTIHPETILELGRLAAAHGLGLVDACLSGGETGAADGTLVYMAGGEAAHVERCRPMLEATGKLVVHTGPLGTGTRMKLCNNVMTYVALRAVFDACRLARAAGLSDAMLAEITQASGVLSDRMRAYAGGLLLPPELVALPEVQTRLAHYLAVAEKDLAIALELARGVDVDLPIVRACADGMAEVYRCAPAGGDDER